MTDATDGASGERPPDEVLEAVFARSERMVGRRIADEFLLVPLAGRGADIDSLYNLNRVGAFIWERLDGCRDGHAVVAALAEHFDVDARRAAADYCGFIAQLESVRAVHRLAAAPDPQGSDIAP